MDDRLAVVIPTHDRPDAARRAVDDVVRDGGDDVVVVVVDDGSTPPLHLDDEHPQVMVLRTPGVGLNDARNLGIEATDCAYVALLDDDVLVQPGWTAALREAFSVDDVTVVAGRITLPDDEVVPTWLDLERWGGYLSLCDPARESGWAQSLVPTGANCAFSRRAYDEVGGFREGLDRDGHTLVSGGETEFFTRVFAAGHTCWYEPRAWVQHDVGAERLSRSYLERRAFGQGLTDARIFEPQRSPSWRHRYLRAVGHVAGGRTAANARLYESYLRGRRGDASGA